MMSSVVLAAGGLAFAGGLSPAASRFSTARRATRPAVALMAANDAASSSDNDYAAHSCHLLTGDQLAKVSDLFSSAEANSDYHYAVCEEPSDDPTVTCFLKPPSWSDDLPGPGDWVCMQNPTMSLTPNMRAEDSY